MANTRRSSPAKIPKIIAKTDSIVLLSGSPWSLVSGMITRPEKAVSIMNRIMKNTTVFSFRSILVSGTFSMRQLQ